MVVMFLCTSQMIQPAVTKLWGGTCIPSNLYVVLFMSALLVRVIISSHHLMLEKDPSDVMSIMKTGPKIKIN